MSKVLALSASSLSPSPLTSSSSNKHKLNQPLKPHTPTFINYLTKMVHFAQFFTAVAALTITGASAFTKPCRYPYDNCGWVLANGDFGTLPFSLELHPVSERTEN